MSVTDSLYFGVLSGIVRCLKRSEMSGKGLKWLKIDGNGHNLLEWLEMAGSGWKLLKLLNNIFK